MKGKVKTDLVSNAGGKPDDKEVGNVEDNPVYNAAPLYKYRHKQDHTILNQTTTDAFCFYQANFGNISPHVQEDMLYWIQDIGEELVIHAIKRTLEQNKTAWSYVKGILRAWSRKGIGSVQQAEADNISFRNQSRGGGERLRETSSEVVPEWFQERKRRQEQERREKKDVKTEQEVTEAGLEALKAAFWGE